MEITAEYQLEDPEIIAAIRHITGFRRRQAVYIGYCAGSSILLLASGMRILQGVGATLAFLAMIRAAALPVSMRRAVKAWRPLVATPTKVCLSDQGCRMEQTYRTTSWQWSAFQKIEATGKAWLFFVAPRTALVIPKRAFTDDQQREIDAMIASRG